MRTVQPENSLDENADIIDEIVASARREIMSTSVQLDKYVSIQAFAVESQLVIEVRWEADAD